MVIFNSRLLLSYYYHTVASIVKNQNNIDDAPMYYQKILLKDGILLLIYLYILILYFRFRLIINNLLYIFKKISGDNITFICSINSLKSCVWFKVSGSTKILASKFYLHFSFTDVHEKFSKFL